MGKIFISILLVLAATVNPLQLRGEDPPMPQKEIPVKKVNNSNLIRSLDEIHVCYLSALNLIHTVVTSGMGQIEITVTNLMTGESWWNTFDSGKESQNLLTISGSAGYYEVEYTTEAGNVYAGEFLIE